MIQGLRNWLRKKFAYGFWYPCFKRGLTYAYENYSIGYRFKYWLRDQNDTKSPAGATEFYQFCWFIIALVWLLLIEQPNAMLSLAWVRYVGVAIIAYRILEIFLFVLNWVFAQEGDLLHGVRRSLAGFILNIFEVALCTSIVLILTDCVVVPDSQWGVAYKNLTASFGLSLISTVDSTCCRVIAHFQLITVGILLTATVASLVGGILRKEKKPTN